MTEQLAARAQALGLPLGDEDLQRLEPMVRDLVEVAEHLRRLASEPDAPE